MAGFIQNPKRARYQANERFDVGDADLASRGPRLQQTAQNRAALSTPRATAGAPVGLIVSGFTLLLNPTGGADGKVRIESPAAVGLDSDGGLIIKPSGLTIDVVIPVGTFQLYVYYQEIQGDTAKRRFLPPAAPFTEFTAAIATTLQGQTGTYVRAGGVGTVVAEDNVNGQTVPLLLIGIVTNAGGAITCTGYDHGTAPNGTDITNRLTAARNVGVPTTPFTNSTIKTLHDMVQQLAYQIGLTTWLGSPHLTPSSANNFGAYNPPVGGADVAFREVPGYVTVGDGSAVHGDIDLNAFANANAALAAAFALLPVTGGKVVLKRGTALSGFNSATLALPAGMTVEITSDHTDVPLTSPHLTFTAAEGLVCSATGKLILRNLHVRAAATAVTLANAPFEAYDCLIENNGTLATSDHNALLQGTDISDVRIERVRFNSTALPNTIDGDAIGLKATATATRVFLREVRYEPTGGTAAGTIQLTDVRSDVVMEDVTCKVEVGGNAIILGSTDNATAANIRNRRISGLTCYGVGYSMLLNNIGWLTVSDFEDRVGGGMVSFAYGGVGPILFERCRFAASVNLALDGNFPDLTFEECQFLKGGSLIGSDSATIGFVRFRRCVVSGQGVSVSVAGAVVEGVIVEDSEILSVKSFGSGDIFGIGVKATTSAGQIYFLRNKVHDFQNINYAIADTTHYPRAFQVLAAFVQHVVCSGNTAKDVLTGATGSNHNGAYLLSCDSADGSDSATTWGTVEMHDNVVGRLGDWMGLFRSAHVGVRIFDTCDNRLDVGWTIGSTKMGDFVHIGLPDIAATPDVMRFDDNVVYINNVDNSGLIVDLWKITSVGVDVIGILSFQNNRIFNKTTNGSSWDLATAWGLNTPATLNMRTLIVDGNAVINGSGSGSIQFETKVRGTVLVDTLPTGGKPGTGVAWANNIMVHGG